MLQMFRTAPVSTLATILLQLFVRDAQLRDQAPNGSHGPIPFSMPFSAQILSGGSSAIGETKVVTQGEER
jgi:hypothetical protein